MIDFLVETMLPVLATICFLLVIIVLVKLIFELWN